MHVCFNCNRSEQEAPLLALNFQGRQWHICPQCLPALIHKPHTLASRLPGMAAADASDEADAA